MDNEQLRTRIQAKREHNETLIRQINTLDQQLEAKQVEYEETKHRRQELEQSFKTIRDSAPWHLLKYLRRRLHKMRSYATGKRNLRQMLKSNKIKAAEQKITRLRKSMEQGFTEKALEELHYTFRTADNPHMARLAAWELALWHADQYTRASALQCLEFVDFAARKTQDTDFLRRAAIIKSESYAQIDEKEEGMQLIQQMLKHAPHPDLYLAAANMERTKQARIPWINKALHMHGIADIGLDLTRSINAYDCLTVQSAPEPAIDPAKAQKAPKVTMIIPVYNGEKGIATTLESISKQTWSNLEILVVDDGSRDQTVDIVHSFIQQDDRITLLSTESNSGPYVARNIALKQATGEFITVNDADDWSHPAKIAEQASHLMANDNVIANTTQHARLTEDLTFYRRGQPGEYIFSNMSSLMFRRQTVMEKLGYWDSVRFGADGEFKRRLKETFGKERIVDLKTGPFSFPRQSTDSLTGGQAYGYHGFMMGARKEYVESHQHFVSQSNELYYPYPMQQRPFPVPEPMWPKRATTTSGTRHFDVVIASEFRLSGGTNMSNIEEIKAQKQMGLKTGLIQMPRYDFHSSTNVNPAVRDLIDGDTVQMLVYGEAITCDVLIVRHPPVLQEWQAYLPSIDARHVRVIINQPPMREYSQNGRRLYDLKRCVDHLKAYTGKIGKWYPIGPSIREALLEHHQKELRHINLAADDWVNIINVDEWKRIAKPQHDTIRIGRHARDQYVKWPDTPDKLLTIYPDEPDYEIAVLGGADVPKTIMGKLPSNWIVYAFGEMTPREFLSRLDVFVYYTHPDWVEAFGRVIFEAMAVGVPVIIGPQYEDLFQEAAIYAEPEEVQQEVDKLMADRTYYDNQVHRAWSYIERHFGYTAHATRLMDSFVNETTTSSQS